MVPSHQNVFNPAAWEQITYNCLTVFEILQRLLKFNAAEPETTHVTSVFKIPLTQVHVCRLLWVILGEVQVSVILQFKVKQFLCGWKQDARDIGLSDKN